MTITCKNGCGATLATVGKNEKGYDVWAEVLENGEVKTGPSGKPVNHWFTCPNKKPFSQKSLDKKHAEVEAGTYGSTYSKGKSLDSVTGTGNEPKSQREEIKEMAEKKNEIALKDIEAQLEVAKTQIEVANGLHDLADAIRSSSRGNLSTTTTDETEYDNPQS